MDHRTGSGQGPIRPFRRPEGLSPWCLIRSGRMQLSRALMTSSAPTLVKTAISTLKGGLGNQRIWSPPAGVRTLAPSPPRCCRNDNVFLFRRSISLAFANQRKWRCSNPCVSAGFHEPSVRIDPLHHRVDRTGRGSEFWRWSGSLLLVSVAAHSRHASARPLAPTKSLMPSLCPSASRWVNCPTVWLGHPGSSSLGAAPCSVVAVARPGSPSTAYSPDHKDVGDKEEDDLPEGAPELVHTGGLSATSDEVILR